ncbi:MAG: SGNH/GDSL hydrolase family protein [Acidimicrobiales bacterium]|nr:SGNH/GDSL hydrolase family protein [Acidimicrobiales bacterium]
MGAPTTMPPPGRAPGRPPGRGRPWIVAMGILALLGVAGVVAWRALPGPQTYDLVVIGDSVSFVSAGSIETRFVDQDIKFVTKPGYTSGDLLPLVYETMDQLDLPTRGEDEVVVLVGYNDVRLGVDGNDSVEELMDVTSQFDCAVWLTLPARPGGEPSTFDNIDPDAIDLWNARLEDLAAEHETVHVSSDWADVVTRASAAELLEDGLHPNVAGQRRLADAMHAAVERSC